MQKRLLTCALSLVSALFGFSQQVINASGKLFTSNNLMLEWSLGEVSIQSTKTDYVWATEGVLQPHNGTAPAPTPENTIKFPSLSSYGLDNAGTTFVNTSNGNSIMIEWTSGEYASRTLLNSNNMVTQGILQPYPLTIIEGPLPVTGLEFTASRIDASNVKLNWKTFTELQNKGFYIERRKDKENSFIPLKFVPSKAANGNSDVALYYEENDANNHSGKSYYRLQQVDLDGKTTYSTIQVVNSIKGKPVKINTYPNPAVKEFTAMVEKEVGKGEASSDMIQIVDLNGRLIQQQIIYYNTPLKITGLQPGVYIVKLLSEADVLQKVIVQ
jgi:hypothetical protein